MILLFTLLGAEYFSDILPLLRDQCLGCHAHGVNMGSLDLETWDGIQRGGNQGTILVPGKPEESRLYTMLVGKAEPRMPLDGRVFPQSSIDAIRRWIAGGAAKGGTCAIAWSPDGQTLAVARGGAVELVDASTGRVRTILAARQATALAFAREGLRLEVTLPGVVETWELASGTVVGKRAGREPMVSACEDVASPDGRRRASINPDGELKIR